MVDEAKETKERELKTSTDLDKTTKEFFQSKYPEIVANNSSIQHWEQGCLYKLLVEKPSLIAELKKFYDERKVYYAWDSYGINYRGETERDYVQAFGKAFPKKYQTLREIKESHTGGGPFAALDVAAPVTSLLDSLKPDIGIAITLTTPPLIHQYPSGINNLHEIEGDIYKRQTWNKLEEKMKSLGIYEKGFNLITLNPRGGQRMPTRAIDVNILQRLYKLTSNDNGIILLRIRGSDEKTLTTNQLKKYLGLLDDEGIDTLFDPINGSICIIKGQNSPEELPLLNTL